MTLTDFQEVIGMVLDISDKQATKVQRAWPESERDLRQALRQWKEVTNSEIRGTDLLAICREVWLQRPVGDLALVEGRKILYHPLTGEAIPEGAPLDHIPLEMLGFLRWATKGGWLQWVDEVTIAREVHEAGSIIANLPGDRFYIKNALPRTADGEIDWSNVALAQAKAFVQDGSETPFSSMPVTPMAPIYFNEDTLEGVLASLPALASENTRNMLLRGLPPGPVGAIRRTSAPWTDIANIVEAVKGFGRLTTGYRHMAIDVLIDNAMRFVEGTQKAKELEAFKSSK